MGGTLAAKGPPINCQIFTTLFRRLNVRLETTSFVAETLRRLIKGRHLFGGRKVHPQREKPGYAYEKPPLRWYAPRMVNPALLYWEC